MSVLVTGAAGFTGMHVAARLLAEGHEVVGLDNLSSYYDVRLKEARLAQRQGKRSFASRKSTSPTMPRWPISSSGMPSRRSSTSGRTPGRDIL